MRLPVAGPLHWAGTGNDANIVATTWFYTTPAAIATVRSVRPRPETRGSRTGSRNSCRLATSIWSSVCRISWSRSSGDPRRFRSCRHFASYLGLTPRERSSGNRRRLGAISKQGNVYLRMLLIHGYAGRTPLLRAPLSSCLTLWREVLIGGSRSTPQTVPLSLSSSPGPPFRSNRIRTAFPAQLSGVGQFKRSKWAKGESRNQGGPGCCLCSEGKERRAGTYKSRRGAGQGSTGSSVGEKPSSHPERGDRSEYATDTGAHGASIVREERRLCIRAADLSTLTVPGWPKRKSRVTFCGGCRSPIEHDPE